MSRAPYLHGYSSPEQQRLLDQAKHWKDRLILKGTHFAPGTQLLEIGCGVGAVLGVLGETFPKLGLHGVDWEPKQLDLAKRHLGSLGLKAQLRQADALALPFGPASFDQAWMMWFLEHVNDPVLALREARRVLKPGGQLTAIEVDYRTLKLEPWTPQWQALLDAFIQGMDATGRSDAGSRLGTWMRDAGFQSVDDRAYPFAFTGTAMQREVEYLLGFIESAIPELAKLPGSAGERALRKGVDAARSSSENANGRLRFEVHKAWAR